jgi:AraC-like DNA-binding protein
VLAAERAIVETEGSYHVEGRYYAHDSDASIHRRRVAERIVRDRTHVPCDDTFAGPPTAVATWLTSRERMQVDGAKPDMVRTRHHADLRGVRADIENGEATSAIVSTALVHSREARELGALIRACPESPIVALVCDTDEEQALGCALLLGRAGVDTLIDCRRPDGWQLLRNAMCDDRIRHAFMHEALKTVLADLARARGGCSDGAVRFFSTIFEPRVASSKAVAAHLGVRPSTLISRFYRAGLPSPKRYATFARLTWAAHFAETTDASYRAIAYRLGASSPQSFGRTLRAFLGVSSTEFRADFSARAMLDHFRAQLIAPYADILGAFDPLAETTPADRATVRRARVSSGSNANMGRAA